MSMRAPVRRYITSDGDTFDAEFRVVAAHNYKSKPGQWYTVEFANCDNESALKAERKVKENKKTKLCYRGFAFFGSLSMLDAPYIVYKGTFRIDENKLILTPGYQILAAHRPTRLRFSDAIYLMCAEFKLYASTRQAVLALQTMIKNKAISVDGKRTVEAKAFEEAIFYNSSIRPTSNYEKAGFKTTLIKIFGYDEKKRKEVIRMLGVEDLAILQKAVVTNPWILCFYRNCGAHYKGLGELSYKGLERALREFETSDPPEYVLVAVRLYQLTIRQAREELKWTCFGIEWIKQQHIRAKWGSNDGPHLQNALVFLLRSGVIIEVTDGMIAREKDVKKAQEVTDLLVAMSERSEFAELRPGNAVPVLLAGELDEGQKRAAQHILEGWPLTIITGSPGTGKSETGIAWVVSRFLRVLVVSFVGTMVMQHVKRIGQAYTIHHVHHTVLYNVSGAEWAMNFDVIVIDEASNASLSLMHKLLKSVGGDSDKSLRGLLQFVIVMDQHQQQPINPGCPALDLKNIFPDHTFELKYQHRQGNGAYIPKSAQLLIDDRIDEVEWRVINSRRPVDFRVVLDNPDNSLVRIDPSSCPSIGQFVNNVMPNVLKDANNDVMEWLFFSFRNKEVDEISHRVREWLMKKGKLDRSKQVLIPDSQSSYSKLSGIKTNKNGLYLSEGTKIIFKKKFMGEWNYKSKKRKHATVYQGEIVIIKSVSFDGREVILEDGRALLMDNKKHVDPRYIKYAYCVTVYASQGLTVDCSVTYIHKNPDERWRRSPLYVAWTRPRKRTIIWGDYKDIKAIADRPPLPRSTILSILLKKESSYDIIKNAPNRHKKDPLPEFRPLSDLWKPEGVDQHGPTVEDARKGRKFTWRFAGSGVSGDVNSRIPDDLTEQEFDQLFSCYDDAEEEEEVAGIGVEENTHVEDGFMYPFRLLDDDDDDSYSNPLKRKRVEKEKEEEESDSCDEIESISL